MVWIIGSLLTATACAAIAYTAIAYTMLSDDWAMAAVAGAEPVVVGGDGFEPGGGGE